MSWEFANPKSFQRRAIWGNLLGGSEGVKWPSTLSITLQSRVARTAQHHKMLTNWILRDKLYSSCCIELPVPPRPIADKHWRQPKSFLSQLRVAEDRIAELEAEIQHYREKSERAEEWLRKISMEIEDRLITEPVEMRRQMSRRG